MALFKLLLMSEPKEKTEERYNAIEKDSPKRSIVKAITWRIIASATTFLISIIFFRQFTDKNLNEILGISGWIAAVEGIAKLIFYYLHERIWLNVKWGKFWRKHYWERRSWKKLYRKMHKENGNS